MWIKRFICRQFGQSRKNSSLWSKMGYRTSDFLYILYLFHRCWKVHDIHNNRKIISMAIKGSLMSGLFYGRWLHGWYFIGLKFMRQKYSFFVKNFFSRQKWHMGSDRNNSIRCYFLPKRDFRYFNILFRSEVKMNQILGFFLSAFLIILFISEEGWIKRSNNVTFWVWRIRDSDYFYKIFLRFHIIFRCVFKKYWYL